MKEKKRKVFEQFGRLDTWIVGTQYYEGAGAATNCDVVFERDPDNPFDPNAVAVLTTTGAQVGHLPRYDAEFLSPLILEGVIALKGHAGEADRGDRLPLSLEVFATARASTILARDLGDDWRAIYHNLFIDIWERLPDYTSATLREFRDRFRRLAHTEPLFARTQFLYRMLKARIADLENLERERLREQVLAAVGAMDFGSPRGWPELAVIPLDAGGDTRQNRPRLPETDACATLVTTGDGLPNVMRLLPSRCPYPPGAHGAIVLVHGAWHRLSWFDSAECAEVCWYQTILDGIKEALGEAGEAILPDASPEAVKARLLAALRKAACTRTGTEEADGGKRVGIAAGDLCGHALYREGRLVHLNLRADEPEQVYDAQPDRGPLTIHVSGIGSQRSKGTPTGHVPRIGSDAK